MRRIAASVASKTRRSLVLRPLACSNRSAQVPSSRRELTSSSSFHRTLLVGSSRAAPARLTSARLNDAGRDRDSARAFSSAPSPAPAAPPPPPPPPPPPSPPDDHHRALALPNNTSDPVTTSSPAYDPVDFELSARIEGEESHIVIVDMKPGECVRAESGSMIFMTDSITMNTTLAGASSAFQRMMTGQNLFLTDFVCADHPGELALGTAFPSKILRLNLQEMEGESLICQKGAYLASNPTVNIEMAFTKNLSTGFFGGQGFVLQKLTGQGDVLVKGGGTIVAHDLREGEKWRVTSGSIVAFESSVDYDIQMMPGIKNAMFGGEGLFVTTLTGPGRVWLQGMPPERMIAEIASRVPAGSGLGFGIPIMGGGGGGGGGGSEASDAGAVDGAVGATAAEQVAATDAAVEADRQATVASSGAALSDADSGPVDAESPSALFGDAAPKDASVGATDQGTSSSSSSASASSSEPSFDESFDDFSTTSSSEPSFDDTSFSDEFSQNTDASDGELFDDTFSSDSAGASEGAASEGGSSILSTLWDFFMGDDE